MTCASLSAHPLKQKSCTRVRWPDGHIDPGVKLTFIHHLLILANSSVNLDSRVRLNDNQVCPRLSQASFSQ